MLLREKGASLDIKDKSGQSPLHLAARNGHQQIIQFLIGEGADLRLKVCNITKHILNPLF